MDSLHYHASLHNTSVKNVHRVSYKEYNMALNHLEEVYACTRFNALSTISYGAFKSQLIDSTTNWNASPGWPFKQGSNDLASLVGWNGVTLDDSKLGYVYQAFLQRWNNLLTISDADPIYLFIKEEPHKQTKADKKAWRLIQGVSVVDRMVDHFLYGPWLAACLNNWAIIPNKAGWTPYRGGYKWLRRRVRNPVCLDRSGWDWTVQPWMCRILRGLISRLCMNSDADWELRLKHRFQAMFRDATLKWRCGCSAQQRFWGVMKTGCLGTICFNSVLQQASHDVANLRIKEPLDTIMCLGDDTIQSCPQNLAAYLGALRTVGPVLKDPVFGYEFAGTVFDEDPRPAYIAKHMFSLCFQTGELNLDFPDMLRSYQYLYAFHPNMLFVIHRALKKLAPASLLSSAYLRWWYKSEE